ncbi:hydroxyisourate hydrolase [Acinetobacter sp. CFCC 10889]|uniref:hydroxyisourate hydrolase n=1 Tax=Acinetobacter sp. CFCC 10889 TaxID=1775557 RepID=UPI000DCFC585|nr:hydroxyisourate hydrolase [Acinetobacter sp. CFCC 10889]
MISTHILDTHLGKPAANVKVKLYAEQNYLAEAYTNADGRVSAFDVMDLTAGVYALEFDVGAYFQDKNTATFFPKAVIHFQVHDISQHYHIPLLISPFAYSTYRGS